jgi:DNA-binding LacI/PurR family transcriptional regulator
VPGDVSVVGWDDIVFAPYLSPPLTTVRLPKQEIGARAMTLLLDLLGAPDQTPEPLELPGELVVRQTTGPGPLLTVDQSEEA